ncbi:unnamed protein product [Leptidea sinapis]|uniref:Uncharacterized protein n=1 Tax=Leptidea sinapis TaxID=189913 RepID=A0A5E4Q7N1_9NEOP|nr:unnamed protein product [Leptidea sinapis]
MSASYYEDLETDTKIYAIQNTLQSRVTTIENISSLNNHGNGEGKNYVQESDISYLISDTIHTSVLSFRIWCPAMRYSSLLSNTYGGSNYYRIQLVTKMGHNDRSINIVLITFVFWFFNEGLSDLVPE